MKHILLYVYLPLIYAALVFLFCLFVYRASGKRIPWRRLCFGWICQRRGKHSAQSPYDILTYYSTSGVVARYRCLCGEEKWKWVAEGEAPKPMTWKPSTTTSIRG